MRAPILIRNAACILSPDAVDARSGLDILLRDGVIADIARDIAAPEGATLLEGAQRLVAPGSE